MVSKIPRHNESIEENLGQDCVAKTAVSLKQKKIENASLKWNALALSKQSVSDQ